MNTYPCQPRRGVFVLGLLVLLVAAPAHGQTDGAPPPSAPDTTLRDTSVQSAEDDQSSVTLDADVSEGETVLETVLEIFLLGPIFLLFMTLLLAFPMVLLGVAVVMDGGCFRYMVFAIGWVCAIFYGMIAGMLVGEGLFGTESLVMPIIHIFTWGYPILGLWVDMKLDNMPEEQYRAWDQTLTGGALLGFGAGSIAGLFRSAASGFGGFGGGSFGGGGASGSWSGASGAASASTGAGSAGSAAAGASAGTAGGTSGGAAATGAASGAAAASSSSTPDRSEERRDERGSLRQWFDKFRWYHGIAFIFAIIVFMPFGLGAMQALQNPKFFWTVLVGLLVYSVYKLLRQSPEATNAVVRSFSSFGGGEGSSSW